MVYLRCQERYLHLFEKSAGINDDYERAEVSAGLLPSMPPPGAKTPGQCFIQGISAILNRLHNRQKGPKHRNRLLPLENDM